MKNLKLCALMAVGCVVGGVVCVIAAPFRALAWAWEKVEGNDAD